MTHKKFSTAPPKEDNATTMSSAPPHPQSQPITEHYIALQFTERHGHCIRRDAYDDGEPFLQLASVAIDKPPGSKGPYVIGADFRARCVWSMRGLAG